MIILNDERMKKSIKFKYSIIACFFFFLATACQKMNISDDMAGFDPEGDLPMYSVNLTGPGQASGERIIDVGEGTLYTLSEGTESPQHMDFIILWSSNTGMNLVSPLDVNRLNGWSAGKTMNDEWLVKNKTEFLKLDASVESQALYEGIKHTAEVKKLYEDTYDVYKDNPELNTLDYGPSMSMRNIMEGDILLMKTSKKVYAAAKVLNIRTGTSGGLELAFKIYRNDQIEIPAVGPNERLDFYETTLDRPGYLNGRRFLDISTGETYASTTTVPQAEHPFFNQEKVDVAFFNSAERGYFNLLSIDDEQRLPLWSSGETVYKDWLTKNSGVFIKIDASEMADSLFLHTYTKSILHDSYEFAKQQVAGQADYAEEIHGPGKFVSALKEGDLIFFRSESKNVLAMMHVSEHTSGGTGKLVLSVRVDNSELQEVRKHPDALNYGQIKIGGWSSAGPEGDTYHVDLASITRHSPASADANQEKIDLLNLWSGSGFANFMTPTSGAVTSWGSSSRIADWTQRNAGTFIRLEDPTAEEEATFDGLVNRELLLQAYNLAEGSVENRPGYELNNHGPGIRVRYLKAGDIIYFKSNEVNRNLYAAIQIISVTPGSSNGREVIEMSIKSNLQE